MRGELPDCTTDCGGCSSSPTAPRDDGLTPATASEADRSSSISYQAASVPRLLGFDLAYLVWAKRSRRFAKLSCGKLLFGKLPLREGYGSLGELDRRLQGREAARSQEARGVTAQANQGRQIIAEFVDKMRQLGVAPKPLMAKQVETRSSTALMGFDSRTHNTITWKRAGDGWLLIDHGDNYDRTVTHSGYTFYVPEQGICNVVRQTGTVKPGKQRKARPSLFKLTSPLMSSQQSTAHEHPMVGSTK